MPDDRLIVITGANGHVGGRVLQHFCIDTNYHVRPHFRTNIELPAWATNCTPSFGDLRDGEARRDALRSASVVVHLATRGYSTRKPPLPSELEKERAATAELVRDAASSGASRFVFISSIHVFGDALVGDVTDSTKPLPTTDYGRSRLGLEYEVMEQCRASSMTGIVVRMTNTFGAPAMSHTAAWDLVVHDLCRQAVTSNRLLLHSNGYGYRNLLALGDASSAIAQVATRHIPSGTYLLAGPRTYQLRAVAELIKVRAEHLLEKSLTVDVTHTDMTHHQPFAFKDTSLRALGIDIHDTFVQELDQLLQAARREFGGRSL